MIHHTARRLLTLAGLAALGLALRHPSALAAQVDTGPRLRVDLAAVNTTELPALRAYVTVIGTDDNYLLGLNASNFRVAEDESPISRFDVKPVIESGEIIATALVIDRSGSMKGRPIADAKAGAKAFLELAGAAELVSVVDFGTQVRVALPLGADKAAATQVIDRIRLSGDTALYDAVCTACQQLAPTAAQRRAIVLLTDGKENRSTGTIEECLQAVAEAGAKVYAIGLGEAEESPLQRLAAESGGLYYYSADSANLIDIYRKISEELHKEYVITAPSAAGEDLEWHRLSVRVTDAGLEGEDSMPFLANTDPEPPIPPPGEGGNGDGGDSGASTIYYYAAAAAMGLISLFLLALILVVYLRRPGPA